MNAPQTIAAIRADTRFAKAAAQLAADHDRIVQDVITLTEIPAPPFGEEQRAAAYLDMLKSCIQCHKTLQKAQ